MSVCLSVCSTVYLLCCVTGIWKPEKVFANSSHIQTWNWKKKSSEFQSGFPNWIAKMQITATLCFHFSPLFRYACPFLSGIFRHLFALCLNFNVFFIACKSLFFRLTEILNWAQPEMITKCAPIFNRSTPLRSACWRWDKDKTKRSLCIPISNAIVIYQPRIMGLCSLF